MKIHNLYKGQLIESYKELCALLEIPVESGNSKKSQIKQLAKAVDFSKMGRYYYINEILEDEIELKTNCKWASDVSFLLLNEISKKIQSTYHLGNNYNEFIISKPELYAKLGFCNKNFITLKRSDIIQKFPEDKRKEVYYFASEVFSAIIRDVLNSLKKNKILEFRYTFRYLNSKGVECIASLEDETLIQECEREVLIAMGYEKDFAKAKTHIYLQKQDGLFYNKLNAKLLQCNMTNVMKVWQIGYNTSCLPHFKNYLASWGEYSKKIEELNQKSYKNLIKKFGLNESDVDNIDVRLLILQEYVLRHEYE